MAAKPTGFGNLEIKKPDSQGRIALGKQYANESYAVDPQSNGDIILRPVVAIHKQEAWLFKNQEALASVKLGLKQSASGELVDLSDFTKYANLDDDE